MFNAYICLLLDDRNVLELITKMISGLSTEMTTIGHTTSNFSTEFADDVVNNRLGKIGHVIMFCILIIPTDYIMVP